MDFYSLDIMDFAITDYDNFMDLFLIGAAKVRSLDFKKMLGAGVLHTKMFLIDKKHFYVGSANMDWRSLTQVLLHCYIYLLTFI